MSTSFSPIDDPGAYLVAPVASGSGDYIWELRASAGLVLGGIDWAVSHFAGFSPLEEWVGKPLAGDWNALDRGAAAWTNSGKAVKAVSMNLKHLPDAISDDWQGEAADAFDRAQAKLGQTLEPIPGACDAIAEMCTALAELAKTITEAILAIANAIADFILQMLASLAVPVAGELAMPVWITALLGRLAIWIPRIAGMIQKFIALAPRIAAIAKIIIKVMATVNLIISVLATLGKVNSGYTSYNDAAVSV